MSGADTPEGLKKKILSNNSAIPSGASTRAATPSAGNIEKTDSIINLTKPPLYSIYNDNSATALNRDDNDDDDDTGLFITKTNVDNAATMPKDQPLFEGPMTIIIAKFLVKVLFLGCVAFIYNEFTSQLRNTHINWDDFIVQPLSVTESLVTDRLKGLKSSSVLGIDHPIYVTEVLLTDALKHLKPLAIFSIDQPLANYLIIVVIQGMIMGLFHPILDYAIPAHINKRLLSSNPNPGRSNIINDVLRSLITFMGISYAIRHMEWASPLQVAVVWSLLSPGLWLILDGTLGGLLASLTISVYGCFFIYITNLKLFDHYSQVLQPMDFLPIWLWTGSFFFSGVIIFGTLGRALFKVPISDAPIKM